MEVHPGLGVERGSEASDLKKKLKCEPIQKNFSTLRELSRKLKSIQRAAFRRKYGNLLGLLELDIEIDFVTTLAQYYDSSMRCFLFQDFQLVPTIEEYEQILDLPLGGGIPYKHCEQHSSIPTISSITKIPQDMLKSRLISVRNTRGFSQRFLEAHLVQLSIKEDWDTFIDVLALILSGAILFPYSNYYVEYAAIDIFVAVRTKSENPVTTVLTYTYLALDLCYERKVRKMLCLVHVLYVWLMARISDNILGVRCPIELVTRKRLDKRARKEWALFVTGLNQKKIIWKPPWQQRSKLIYSCEGFPNVPLIGVRGCISYNPVLAQRQFGYPIRGTPTPVVLVPFVCYYQDGFVNDTLCQIRNAWKSILCVEKDTKSWSVDREIPYQQWLLDRVREVKLPYKLTDQEPLGEPVPKEPTLDTKSEEVQKLKEEVERLKRKNDVLNNDMQSLQHEYLNVKVDNERLMKRQKVDKECIMEMTQELTAAKAELITRAREWEAAMHAECQEARQDRQKIMKELYDLQDRFHSIESRMKEIMSEYEEKLKEEQWQKMETKERHQIMMTQLENHIADQERDIIHWRTCFSQLAALANGAIEDVPRILREADSSLMFFNFPDSVQTFLNHCKYLVEQMKVMIAHSRD